jgi:uncharacterized protein YneF (UPF0154 family)
MEDIMNIKKPNNETIEEKKHFKKHRSIFIHIILGLIILISGMATGSGLTIIIVRKAITESLKNPEIVPGKITKRMTRKFNLNENQAEKVEEILTRHIRVLREIRRETWPRVSKELNLIKEDVAEILDEKQEKKWRKRFNYLEKNYHIPPE